MAMAFVLARCSVLERMPPLADGSKALAKSRQRSQRRFQ
jgi:hypothetical protein